MQDVRMEAATEKIKPLMETLGDHESFVNCMCVSDDESILVTGADDATAILWNIDYKAAFAHHTGMNRIEVKKEPKSGGILSIRGRKRTEVIVAEPGFIENLGVFKGHGGHVLAVAIDTKSGQLVTSSSDCTVRKWDMKSCACTFVYEGHTKAVHK